MNVTNVMRIAAVALLLVFAGSYTSPLGALPENEIEIFYYNGCGLDLTEVGYYDIDCHYNVTQRGQQSGEWKAVYTYSCTSSDQGSAFYEWCQSAWVQRSTLGN